MINWKVRIKNKAFWVSVIPAILLLIQVILAVFDISIDFTELGNKLLSVVNAAFVVLAIFGIAVDPTTAGVSDSEKALTYIAPGVSSDEIEDTEFKETGDLDESEVEIVEDGGLDE